MSDEAGHAARPAARLKRNVAINIASQVAPLLAALLAVPLILKGFGEARFGLLSLAWALNASFGYFDLGLGRALTKVVSDRLGREAPDEIPGAVRAALLFLLPVGLVGALGVAVATPWLANDVLSMAPELTREARLTFYLMALSVPLTVASAAVRGVLEAHQRFGLVSAVRTPVALAMLLSPIATLPLTESIAPAIALLVVIRLAGLLAYGWFSAGVVPGLYRSWQVDRVAARELIGLAGWISATNLISPLVAYIDRFMIGARLALEAVPFYTTPYEVISRALVVPGAIVGVLYPAFAEASQRDGGEVARLYARGLKLVFLLLFPPLLFAFVFAWELMAIWIDPLFADQSAAPLRWLCLAMFTNGLAYVPFALVQALGRPDLNAKYNLLELPVFPFIVWGLIGSYGVEGAAAAWFARNLVAALAVIFFALRLMPETGRGLPAMLAVFAFSLALMAGGLLLDEWLLRGGYVLLIAVLSVLAAYRWMLDAADRAALLALARRRKTG